MADNFRLRGEHVGGWLTSMLADPNKVPGPAAGTADKTSVVCVRNVLSVAETLWKLMLVRFKRLELATVQPFVRSEKAH
jgi:hypothetical protein